MDSRDLPRDADGLPIIPDRDRLPLRWLCEGACQSGRFNKAAQAIVDSRIKSQGMQLREINNQREAVALDLSLPSWWHYCPVRSIRGK
jgi:hypothetical protein